MTSSSRARASARAPRCGTGHGRSACPGASRNWVERCNPPARASPTARPGRREPACAVIWPGDGRKSFSGSSELIRHSMEWPRVTISSWRKGQGLAGGDPDLLLDQVDAGDHLGDGVLDLDPRVDLDEVEPVLGIDQELAGAGVDVAHRPGQADGGLAKLLADRQRQRWGRAPPRPASDAAAGASSRGPSSARHCRGNRRGSGPRRGGGGR